MSNALLPTQRLTAATTATTPLGWTYRVATPAFRVRGPRDRDVWNIAIDALSRECAEYQSYLDVLHTQLDALEDTYSTTIVSVIQQAGAVLGKRALLTKDAI